MERPSTAYQATVLADCRWYRGSLPCEPHKLDGRPCEGCDLYEPIGEHVLIIKLGALGDVLRTTALLPDLAARHDRPAITWITRPDAVELLDDHPLVWRCVAIPQAVPVLLTRRFAAAYTLDADEDAAALSLLARAGVRYGYRPGAHGTMVGVEPGGDDTLFAIGLSDARKRANVRQYLDLLAASCGARYSGGRPALALRPATVEAVAGEFAALPRPLVGINADAAPRWRHKRWTAEHTAGLVALQRSAGMGTVLFGEGDEARSAAELAARDGATVRAFESAGRLDRFFAAIAQLDALVTTDSLAMHAAWALRTPIVALFGPTSSAEITLGPEDTKLAAALPCLACYLHDCDVDPHCMELLESATVFDAVRRRIGAFA
jgi:ADP-heptose:LPS heptosyltransferase